MSASRPGPCPALVGRVFDGVDGSVLTQLVAWGATVQVDAGARIIHEGDRDLAFFALLVGCVRVFYQAPTGSQLTCKIFGAPAVFGEMECLIDREYMESVEAVEPAILLKVPREQFLRALHQSPRLTRNLLDDLARRLAVAADHERSLAFHSVDTRLANLLLSYVRDYAEPTPRGPKIRIPLTHDEISLALGVARKSVTRAMRRWRQEGILDKDGAHWIVMDLAALRNIGDPTLLSLSYRAQ